MLTPLYHNNKAMLPIPSKYFNFYRKQNNKFMYLYYIYVLLSLDISF